MNPPKANYPTMNFIVGEPSALDSPSIHPSTPIRGRRASAPALSGGSGSPCGSGCSTPTGHTPAGPPTDLPRCPLPRHATEHEGVPPPPPPTTTPPEQPEQPQLQLPLPLEVVDSSVLPSSRRPWELYLGTKHGSVGSLISMVGGGGAASSSSPCSAGQGGGSTQRSASTLTTTARLSESATSRSPSQLGSARGSPEDPDSGGHASGSGGSGSGGSGSSVGSIETRPSGHGRTASSSIVFALPSAASFYAGGSRVSHTSAAALKLPPLAVAAAIVGSAPSSGGVPGATRGGGGGGGSALAARRGGGAAASLSATLADRHIGDASCSSPREELGGLTAPAAVAAAAASMTECGCAGCGGSGSGVHRDLHVASAAPSSLEVGGWAGSPVKGAARGAPAMLTSRGTPGGGIEAGATSGLRYPPLHP